MTCATRNDLKLVALCADLHRHREVIDALDAGPDTEEREAHLDVALDNWWTAADTIEATSARTPAGFRAKAEALQLMIRHVICVYRDQTFEDALAQADADVRHAWSLACDLLGQEAWPEASVCVMAANLRREDAL